MKIIKTKFKGLIIIKQNNFTDKRGNLRVTFVKKKYKRNLFLIIAQFQKKVF